MHSEESRFFLSLLDGNLTSCGQLAPVRFLHVLVFNLESPGEMSRADYCGFHGAVANQVCSFTELAL